MAEPLKHTGDTPAKTDSAPREARLEIRLSQEQKALVTRAAAARGGTVAEFVRQAVQDAAVKTVSELEVLRLCAEDREAFAAALLAPREPSARLKAAYTDTRERVEP
jgi:uncharacterized protein (DUF1778 family)